MLGHSLLLVKLFSSEVVCCGFLICFVFRLVLAWFIFFVVSVVWVWFLFVLIFL